MITKDNYHYIHRLSKRTIPIFKKPNRFTEILKNDKRTEKRNPECNNYIANKIKEGLPFMAARFGSTEARAMVNYELISYPSNELKSILNHLSGKIGLFWKKDSKYLNDLYYLSGFFPNEEEHLGKFVELMKDCTTDLDLLGIWNGMEEYIREIPTDCYLAKIRDMEPWFFADPWSSALEGKKVLVIHPFEETIIHQYKQRENLYCDKNILPEFDLITIKAVQTIAGQTSDFKDWFQALNFMKEQVDKTDFDVAIIGCGAYGFPLASHIKRIGKQALHLGGVTQLLFGIKGKRWEEWEHYTKLRKNHGNAWIFAKEKPVNYNKIENGCNW